MRPSKPTDFEESARAVSLLIFSDIQKASGLLDSMQPAATGDQLAKWHFLRGQLFNEKHQFAEAAQSFEKAIDLLESSGNRYLLADSRLELAAVQTNLGQLGPAEETLALVRNFVKKSGDSKLLARLAGREGFLKLHEGNREQALLQLLDVQRIMADMQDVETPRDLAFRTRIENGLYEIYQKNEDHESAATASLDALKLAEANGLHTRISWLYLNAGRAFDALGDVERAAHYYQKAAREGDGSSPRARASANANLGILLVKHGQVDAAEERLRLAAELFGEPKAPADFSNLSLVEAYLAQSFMVKEMDEEAEAHLSLAIELGQRGDNLGHATDLCRQSAEYFARKGDFEKAFRHSRLADHLARNVSRQEREAKIHEISIRYDADNRRREAEMARTQAVSLQLRALRAQMNPHFVFNALNSVQSMLMQGLAADASDWLVRFSRLMRRALDLSNAETVTLEEEIEFLRNYLEINQKLRFREKLSFEITIDDDLETDFIHIPTMIVQPYVENAIEHGIKPRGGGHIRISFFENEEHTLVCTIEDNGFGFFEMARRQANNPDPGRHRSRGREITEERLALLHRSAGRRIGEWVRTTDLSTIGGQGTQVEILIPEIG